MPVRGMRTGRVGRPRSIAAAFALRPPAGGVLTDCTGTDPAVGEVGATRDRREHGDLVVVAHRSERSAGSPLRHTFDRSSTAAKSCP